MSAALLSRRELLATAAALAVPASLVDGCGGDDEPDALARMRRAGFVRLGIAEEPPFGYTEPGGRVTGYAVEAAREAFAALGVPRVVGVVTEFELLIDGVRSGVFDVVAGGLFVLPERCRRVSFSVPIYTTGEAFAVRAGNPLGLRDFSDVARRRDARIGALAGSVEVTDARRAGVPDARILPFASRVAMRAALESGAIDAAALTTISVRRLIAESDRPERLEVVPPFTVMEDGRPRASGGALAYRHGDDRVREGVDRQLRRLQRSGALRTLGRRFGLTAEEVDGARSQQTAALCRPRG